MTSTNKPTGTRGYCLIRTSKDEQDKRSQRDRCERWLRERQLKPLAWLEDSGARDLSGRRPNFQRLLGLIQAGQVDWVLVSERDRLGFADAWEYGHFIHIFRSHGTQLWTVADDRDLTSGDRYEPIIATLAADKSQHEQKENADRTIRAKIAAVRRGEWPGGKPPYGYDLVAKDKGVEVWRLVYEGGHRRCCYYPDGTIRRYDGKGNTPARDKGITLHAEVTRDRAVVGWVRKIFEWHNQGLGCRTIAKQLTDLKVPAMFDIGGVWIGPTLQAMLKNPIYVSGVPHWNKQGHGRFVEVLGGQHSPVARVNGKAKTARKRNSQDHIRADQDRPENAIIDWATWDKAQERFRVLAATPKRERRPKCGDLYYSGLLRCSDCLQPMSAWKQVEGYRCSTNARMSSRCRCNRTSHDLIEQIVVDYLGRSQRGIEWLRDNAEHAADLYLLAEESKPLAEEFTREITYLWRLAKKDGARPKGKAWDWKSLRKRYGPKLDTEGLEEEVKAKEQERGRLLKRMGLLDDEAAQLVAGRVNELTAEIRGLRERLLPQADRLEGVRETLGALLERTRATRETLERGLPRQKEEAVRRVISHITVEHRERMAGVQRRSEVVGVVVVPHVGPAEAFRGENQRARG